MFDMAHHRLAELVGISTPWGVKKREGEIGEKLTPVVSAQQKPEKNICKVSN